MRAGANVKRQGLCVGSCFRLMQRSLCWPRLGGRVGVGVVERSNNQRSSYRTATATGQGVL